MLYITQLLARAQAREKGELQPPRYRDFDLNNSEEEENVAGEEEDDLNLDALY
jgi:hypothetical protein